MRHWCRCHGRNQHYWSEPDWLTLSNVACERQEENEGKGRRTTNRRRSWKRRKSRRCRWRKYKEELENEEEEKENIKRRVKTNQCFPYQFRTMQNLRHRRKPTNNARCSRHRLIKAWKLSQPNNGGYAVTALSSSPYLISTTIDCRAVDMVVLYDQQH